MTLHSSACGKVILCGEHAVVYGHPALALPLPQLRAQASLDETTTACELIAPDLQWRSQPNPDSDSPHALEITLFSACAHFEVPLPRARIQVQSQLPIARGLGSGTAMSAAIFRLIQDYAGQSVPQSEELSFIHQMETQYHGQPSGIDGAVVSSEKALRFVRGQAPQSLEIPKGWRLMIADSGESAPTKIAVDALRVLRQQQPTHVNTLLDEIATLTHSAQIALQDHHWQTLGALLTHNHVLLQKLTLSSERLDHLVDAACAAGALGAKLSGGGRGGVVIALTLDQGSAIADAWAKLGVIRQWELQF